VTVDKIENVLVYLWHIFDFYESMATFEHFCKFVNINSHYRGCQFSKVFLLSKTAILKKVAMKAAIWQGCSCRGLWAGPHTHEFTSVIA
jgi:hypothetical protein